MPFEAQICSSPWRRVVGDRTHERYVRISLADVLRIPEIFYEAAVEIMPAVSRVVVAGQASFACAGDHSEERRPRGARAALYCTCTRQ
eukprot:2656424-Pleurochrysis_carterae.AAC.1